MKKTPALRNQTTEGKDYFQKLFLLILQVDGAD